MPVNWNDDTLCDIISPLQVADRLSHEQCFTTTTKERTKEIYDLCIKSRDELEDHISDLEEELR